MLAEFLSAARESLDVAIYDLAPSGPAADTLRAAFQAAAGRGVRVRLLFNQEPPRRSKPLPPPGFVDWDWLKALGVPFQPIPGEPDLMHHKYVVRDVATPEAAVWTGSTNWTTDSWTREENVIVRLAEPVIAAAYGANFEELFQLRSVQGSGQEEPEWRQPQPDLRLRAFFTPGRAQKLVHEIAQRLALAQRRIRICSPVLTSGPVLASLAETISRQGPDIAGCFDETQMDEVRRQWGSQPQSAWKLGLWARISSAVPWGAKRSEPYAPGSLHDFMHAKCTVADDTVFVGSFNLSHSGEANAENVLQIEHAPTADAFAGYIDEVRARYPWTPPAAKIPGGASGD
ncbi:MAG: phospholipase D-like domain-containing protein [Candidatus Dormibacter sp.]|uniref:phospholipase D-like domain-containing protein n=1 Tax=Candidatus Dormibacter sp. TaxID=2973982 RepID=UPI000DB52005|nr:MAG: hypothetical protein DLM66_09835 [Candidatus Dormibacteraeota bacterium]